MNADPEGAFAYHDALKKRNMIHPAGAAAPRHYRFFYRLFGFRNVEEAASIFRKVKHFVPRMRA